MPGCTGVQSTAKGVVVQFPTGAPPAMKSTLVTLPELAEAVALKGTATPTKNSAMSAGLLRLTVGGTDGGGGCAGGFGLAETEARKTFRRP